MAEGRHRAWGVAVVWSALFCDYVLMTLVIPIFPKLGVSDVEVGVLFSAKAAVQVVTSPLVARVVDGCGLLPMLLGLLIELLTSIGFTISSQYSFWFVMRAIQGLASAAILSSGFLHVQQLHAGDSDALGNAMGTVITGIIGGVMLGPPLGGLLFEVGDKWPFWFSAAIIGVSISCAAVYMQRHNLGCGRGHGTDDAHGGNGQDQSESEKDDNRSTRAKICALLHDKHVLVVLGALFFANAAISCLEATAGLHLEDALDMTPGQVGLMYMATAGPSVLGSKVGGWLGNKYGRWKIIMRGMVLQGAFYALGPKSELGVVLVSFIGLGFGMGLVDGCSPALLSDVGQLYHGGTGVVFTLQTAAIQLGFIAGPVCGSALMQHYDYQTMSIALGALMILFAPIMTVDRKISDLLEQQKQAQALEPEHSKSAEPVEVVQLEQQLQKADEV